MPADHVKGHERAGRSPQAPATTSQSKVTWAHRSVSQGTLKGYHPADTMSSKEHEVGETLALPEPDRLYRQGTNSITRSSTMSSKPAGPEMEPVHDFGHHGNPPLAILVPPKLDDRPVADFLSILTEARSAAT
jgi:hypothetical protein